MSRRIVVPILEFPYCSLLASDALCRISPLRRPISLPTRLPVRPTRSLSSCTSNQDKAIVLEKPDKFRPPSHPARLNARRIPRHYPGPPILEAEKEAQATRKYPHTFPNEGTKMYWFLTNRYVHLWISLGTLAVLSLITLTHSFLHTSPFANLTPGISTLPTAPFAFFRDWISAVRMHQQYHTLQTAASREKLISDAKKRRLYRRAHGMEDLDKEGDGDGIDITGLVGWDDGLTKGERQRLMVAAGEAPSNGDGDDASQTSTRKRPVKKWLGIW